MKKPILSILKNQQINILLLLYQFRFLKRTQIQTLLKHKLFNRVIIWLNDLTEKEYIKRYFNQKIAPSVSVYSLGTKSRTYFLKNPDEKIHINLLDRVWREHKYSVAFRNHWILLADIYISLLSLTEKRAATLRFLTQVDLDGVEYLVNPSPDAFFSITEKSGSAKRYFLDIFDPNVTRIEMYKRINQYFSYYELEHWQDHNKNPFPSIIFIAPNDWAKGYLLRTTKKILRQKDIELEFYLSSWEEIQKFGINKEVLYRVE